MTKDNQEILTRSAELLLQGATMLQIPCPDCSSPIYRLKDSTMRCATCNKQVIFERNLDADYKKQLEQKNSPIQLKIEELTRQLEQEEDPDKIIKLAETIKKLKEIL